MECENSWWNGSCTDHSRSLFCVVVRKKNYYFVTFAAGQKMPSFVRIISICAATIKSCGSLVYFLCYYTDWHGVFQLKWIKFKSSLIRSSGIVLCYHLVIHHTHVGTQCWDDTYKIGLQVHNRFSIQWKIYEYASKEGSESTECIGKIIILEKLFLHEPNPTFILAICRCLWDYFMCLKWYSG